MDQLVFHSHEIDASLVTEALPEVAVSTVYAKRSLVEAIVSDAQLVGMIVETDSTDGWTEFLESIHQSFPLIPLLVLGDVAGDGYTCVSARQPRERILAEIADFYTQPRPAERRRHHRYDWPLRATLTDNESVHKIHEISAGGAFLEPVSPIPQPGAECEIQIHFRNFTMTTRCEILDPRHVSSRSAPGFGVRFVALSESAEEFVDSIVHDALVRVLLDPENVPEIPSIDEEEDILAVGDEFSLSL